MNPSPSIRKPLPRGRGFLLAFALALAAALALILGALLAACAPPLDPLPAAEQAAAPAAPAASPTPWLDSLGKPVQLGSPAQRIISLAPASTEIVFALGAGDRLVGRDAFSDYPEAAKAAADIGGGFGALNQEALVALQPDLVLASDLTPPEQTKALEDLGLTVVTLANPRSFDGLYANLRLVGALTGNTSEADALIASLQGRVAAVESALAGVTDRPLVFYELDSTDPAAIWTPGPGTFIEILIQMAGGENLGSRLTGEWAQISLEALLEGNPEVILLGDATWGGVTVEAAAARTGWSGLSAVKNGRLYTFDDNLVSRPGPRLVDGLEALARLLHPDRFK